MVTQGTLILFYVVLTYTVRRRADLDLLLLSFVVGCLLAAASGWLGYGLQVEGGRYEERLAGEGSSPNLLAFNLIVAIPAAASLMFTTRRGWARPFYFAAIGLMIVACLSTLSRTAFVALPAMVAFWAFRFRRFSFLRYAAPVFLLVVSAAIFAPERVVLRAQDVVNAAQERSLEELDPSARDRFLMVPGMARAFASNPLIGVGLSHYRWWAFQRGEVAHGIHNAYLQVLVEQGLVGFVPFVVILVLTWRTYTAASRTLRRRGDAELGILGFRAALLQAALTGALVMGLAQPSGRHKAFWLLFAMSTILIALVRERVRALESPARPAPSHPGLSAGSYGEWVPRPAS
jgi:O-antigen ligase